MTTVQSATLAVELPTGDPHREADIAAAAFLARCSGRTLESYRYDLRSYFQWATDVGLAVMEATRPHIELYRAALEARGLAPATADRRLSTVCGFSRFAHIDGRIGANPAQYVRRPTCIAPKGAGLTVPSSGASSSLPSVSTTIMAPWQCSSAWTACE